ncbi:type IV pilus assembly protein PilM [Desulfurobacterium thermolithotrophum]|uniref:type IV pilus assembly protein PilM n=1 Tax=Desulfurobacterium thermolithotrophum TaxID=64160 RepID=UPI0013D0D435|nr:type IV pilus assembly protein PilM [Desulfurobacterium thermolithotrophum]
MGWLTRFFKSEHYYLPGLDIGSYSIKLVQLKKDKDTFKLKTKSEYIYEEQVFAGTEIVDLFLLASYLKEIVKTKKIEEKNVAIHVPLSSCFYSVISIPPSKKIEEAVMNYIQSMMTPQELTQVKIDYKVLPVSIEKKGIDVAIAAVKKEFLKERISVVEKAGLNPVIVDIEPAAFNNQFYLNYPENTASPVCLVDFGASFTRIVISFGGYPYVTRNVEYGGYSITEQIQKEFMLSFEDAEKLKKGTSTKDVTYKEVFDKVIVRAIKKITTEILWTVENFKDRFNQDVNEIYFFGGSSKIEGLVDVVKKLTGKKVYRGFPFKFDDLDNYEEFGIATGLSLRYKGDSNVKI